MSHDAPCQKRRRRRSSLGLVRQLARDSSGATAVEFALIAGPFLFIMYVIIETAYIFYVEQTLDTAVQEASRKIMTRQYTMANTEIGTFKGNICGKTMIFINCQSNLKVDVKPVTNLTKNDIQKPLDGNGNFSSAGFILDAPATNRFILVRAAFMHKSFVPMLDSFNNYLGGGNLIMSSYAFKIEPDP